MQDLNQHLDDWLHARPTSTASAYRATCRQFITQTATQDLAAITPGSVLDWKNTLRRQGFSDQTIINSLSRISRFLDYAIASGLHPGPNPARDQHINRPHSKHKPPQTITLDQINHILQTAGHHTASGARASALILVALAGANPLALRWGSVPNLPPAVRTALQHYAARTKKPADQDTHIFTAWKTSPLWRDKKHPDDPISRAQISSTLGRLGQRAGVPHLSQRTLNATVRHMRRTPRGAALLHNLLHPTQ